MRFGRFLLLAALAASPVMAKAPDGPLVQIDTGRVAGVAERDVSAFKGIPYAAPPIGPLRWRAPMPAATWNGIRDASHYGAACPQAPDHKEPWAQVGPTSEDCLFLNVWRPKRAGKYPVMVFLHGGGFTYGAAGVPLYDGTNLARRGVVLVSINYRLGLLGFFAHPALTKADRAGLLGNYGLMDAIAALRWVKRNIAAFGGDAANVTVFGESAGAGMVQTLMGSPEAEGLFQKAISESGAGGSVLMPIRRAAASAEKIGDQWAASVGLPNATTEQLRALPVQALLKRSFPFIDGKVIVASPGAPFSRGTEAKVPLIIGANSNESTLAGNNDAVTRKVLGGDYDGALKDYTAVHGGAARTELAEDALSILASYSIAAMHAANGAHAYNFYFDQVPANLRPGSAGTPHGGELEYLFGNPDTGSVWDAADRKVSDTMAGYWVRFAATGNPNGIGAPSWPLVTARGANSYLVIGTPTRAEPLSAAREKVRLRSLATSREGWEAKAAN